MKWEIYALSHGRVFGGTQSGVGYLRVWEGHGQWFLLSEFLHCGNNLKITCKWNKGLFGICFANFAIFPKEIVKSCHFRYYIHKSYQYKTGFWKKIYNPSRIEILMLGDFQNVRGFVFWIGPISIKNLKNLEVETHPQCPSNTHTHFLKIFLLKLLDFYG